MSVCGRCLPFRLNRRTICASCGHSLLSFDRWVAEPLHLLLLLVPPISRNIFERYTSVTPVVVSDFVQASLVEIKCGTGRKKTPLMQKSDDLTPFAHPGFEPVISGLSRPFAFNTKTFGKRVPQSPFQDGIFITRSPPESASCNGTRRISYVFRKNLPYSFASNRFVRKLSGFGSGLFVLSQVLALRYNIC